MSSMQYGPWIAKIPLPIFNCVSFSKDQLILKQTRPTLNPWWGLSNECWCTINIVPEWTKEKHARLKALVWILTMAGGTSLGPKYLIHVHSVWKANWPTQFNLITPLQWHWQSRTKRLLSSSLYSSIQWIPIGHQLDASLVLHPPKIDCVWFHQSFQLDQFYTSLSWRIFLIVWTLTWSTPIPWIVTGSHLELMRNHIPIPKVIIGSFQCLVKINCKI